VVLSYKKSFQTIIFFQTISTFENVYEVEAVMDITIDIEKAASMANIQVYSCPHTQVRLGLG
jgi:hypothetical protein